ncbi:GDT1-like protein 2, chloroplastic isoform X2 [Physcomitrium patens]|uniref:GDT1-like protein 2, chloroplastic isoform X2 n=1 Tax=Physcomitrium patens TaxID=3218 RepID=UPI000D157B37|nr:GDT1-like protein 2, chloroplastic isoform X2 [Physcomitrium patens]|eukprot:XP_024385279.1 GDT1-like protein 2, chloroplastic isoform X2 [Physcomitrella patens]
MRHRVWALSSPKEGNSLTWEKMKLTIPHWITSPIYVGLEHNRRPWRTDRNQTVSWPKDKQKATLQAIAGVAALVGLGTLGGVALTLSKGGPAALMAAIAKSGFSAAFALIFVSEIGDKTFFIAALLAMRHSRVLVLLGATGALSLMTIISVIIGRIFQSVPAQLQTTLPIGEYAAVALLIWFGFRSIKAAWDLPSEQPGTAVESSDSGELAEAQEFLEKSETKKVATPLQVVTEAFSLVFVAEWGDRSMLATVALGAAQSPWGVASGAIAGHVIATALAVLGGAFLAQYISEKVVGYTGGVLFLVFAAATLLGVF